MARIAGLDYQTNSKGQIYKVTFDLKKIGNSEISELIDDIIDGLEAEAVRRECSEYIPLEDVFAKEDKRRGIKHVQSYSF
jgi:hypothetical protein